MKNSEVTGLTDKEIVEKIQTEKQNLLRVKMNHAVSPIENPQRIKELRRNVARLKTELRRREISENK